MYLTSQIHINSNSKYFYLADFLSHKTKQIKNQVLYSIRQPWLYYDNLKKNKPVFQHQLDLINQFNLVINQYNKDLLIRNINNQLDFIKEQKLIQINNENKDITDNKDNTDIKTKIITKEFKAKKLLKPISSDYYWLDNKDFLQFYCKTFDNYGLLHSQTSQQVIGQVLLEFKSFRELIKFYQQKTIKFPPKIPYYLDKVNQRNLVCFSNQQIRVSGQYLILYWQGKDLINQYKEKNYNTIDEIELDDRNLARVLSIHNKSKIYKELNNKEINSTISTDLILKDNKNLKQEIIHKLKINDNKEQFYQPYLQTTYHKLPNEIRVKIPSNLKELLNNHSLNKSNKKDKLNTNINNVKLTEIIKQIRLVPDTEFNPNSYTLEFIYEKTEYKLEDLNSKLNKLNSSIVKPLFNLINEKDLTQEYKLKPISINRLNEELKIKFNTDLSNLKIASIDPGFKRLISMTNNQGLKPLIFKDNSLVAFNQWYNKILATHQNEIKTKWDKSISQKIRNLNTLRHRKINYWLHELSDKIVDYLEFNKFDLLVIGKNKNQKQEINIGKINNQGFVQLPMNKLWQKISYKAYQKGILIIEQEESYTSKASFINEDFIPTYNESKLDYKYDFSGIRDKVLYKIKKNKNNNSTNITQIHSDLNGSYNILRKLLQTVGLNFNLNNLNKNYQKNKLNDNSNNINKISRKFLHQVFQPTMLNFNNIKEVNSLNC